MRSGGGDAQPQQTTGSVLEIARKVLATHAGQRDLVKIGFADDLARRPDAGAGHVGVVNDGVGTAMEFDLDRSSAGLGQTEGDLANPLVDPGRRRRAQGPDRPLEQDVARG